MRKSFILGSIAAAMLAVGGLAGIGQASASGDAPAADAGATPTTVPGLDSILSVLTPEQLDCMIQNIGGVDVTTMDFAAISALFTTCGISMDQLTGIDPGTGAVPTTAGVTLSVTGEAPDVSAVLASISLDANDVACIVSSMASGTVTDEATAYNVLSTCGIALLDVLNGIVVVGSGTAVTPTPGVATTLAAIPATTAASGADPMAQMVIDMFGSIGITLTTDQASCVAQQISAGIDTSDQAQILALMQTCGITFG